MTPERWRQISELFNGAVSRAPDDRAAFLTARCDDDDLRREVESMLAAHEAGGPGILSGVAVPAMRLATGTIVGAFRIDGVLGVGGMGEVYRAHDTTLGREVALKVLPDRWAADPDRVARFEREAHVLATLNHPNIATIFGVVQAGQVRALVLELVEGITLFDRIADGPVPIPEALRIAHQIAQALEAAHERDVAHRDLKPANVKLRPDGTVKVLDFGLARAIHTDSGSRAATITAEGRVMGTVGYMSPEQAGGGAVTQQTDIWAFGVILFELLAGRRPFAGHVAPASSGSREAANWALLPPGTPSSIRRVLQRCLAVERSARLHAIADARIEIEDAMQPATQEPVGAPAVRKRLSPAAYAALMGAAALLGGIGYVAGTRGASAPPAGEIRLSLLPPDGARFVNVPALSPDGRQIALVVASDQGKRLWIRSLSSATATPIAGTDGAEYPFWSPDSRDVGFFADGKLQRISASGGMPVTVCATAGGRGGVWLDDGSIVFAPIQGPLLRVAASGGQPANLTELDTAAGELNQRFPARLPDGRLLYFSWQRGGPEQSGIRVLSLADPRHPVTVLTGDSAGEYENGHLVFSHYGDLLEQPFDLNGTRLTGTPVRLGNVSVSETLGRYMVSAYGHVIAFGEQGVQIGQLTWISRDGRVLDTNGAQDEWNGVELSRDGRMIATTSPAGRWIVDLDGHTMHRVIATSEAFPRVGQGQAVWSPDGATIAFASSASPGSGNFKIFAVSSRGGTAQTIVSSATQLLRPIGWTPDAKQFVWVETDDRRRFNIVTAAVSANEQPSGFIQDGSQNLEGRLSPDGKWMAYTTDQSGTQEVSVRAFPNGATSRQVSVGGGRFPRWRADGRELYYIAPNGSLMAVSAVQGPVPEFGSPRRLFDTPMVSNPDRQTLAVYQYDVSPDGSKFLINRLISQRPTTITMILNKGQAR